MKKKLIHIMILSSFLFFTAATSFTPPGSASAQALTPTRTPTPINIGNFVWDDLDQDGTQDAGEPGIAGVSVQLWNSAKSQLLSSTSTSASGGYTLVAPVPGNYRVRVVLPSASDAFSPKDAALNDQTDSDINPSGVDLGFTNTFNIASNVISTTIYDAGIIKFRTATPTRTPTPINIGNFVWDDLDKDGTQDAGEPGIAGVSVQLWNSAKSQLLSSTSTSASGGYTLVAPVPGNYRVRVVLPSASDAFSPKDAALNDQTDSDINPSGVDLGFTNTFNIASNVISTTIYDAGIIKFRTATPTRTPTPINIGNFVWYDLDGDGIQDAGEPGIAGVVVQLWNAAKNNLIFSAVTDANGIYTVIAPVPGDYRVRVVPFSGSSFSPKNQGANDTKDSDINTSILTADYGFTDIFTIATNVISTTIYDAGLSIVGPTLTSTRTRTPTPIITSTLTPTRTRTPTSTPTSTRTRTPAPVITLSGNTGVGGVVLSYTDGTAKTVTSDASGNYSLPVRYNWSGTVVPSRLGYVFTPLQRTYTNVLANKPAQNYTATQVKRSIAGDAGVGGARLSYVVSGVRKSVIANSNGSYVISVPYGWSGKVVPSKSGVASFQPAYRTYSKVKTNLNNQNYQARFVRTYFSAGSKDGHVVESSESSGVGGTISPNNPVFFLGDTALNRQVRGILSFDTSNLPENAQILSIKLKITKQGVTGADPMNLLGTLLIDIVDPYFGSSVVLDLEDFYAIADRSMAGWVSKTPVGAKYIGTLNNVSFPYISKAGTTQLRLRFMLDDNNNRKSNYLRFFSGDSSSGKPELQITFYIP